MKNLFLILLMIVSGLAFSQDNSIPKVPPPAPDTTNYTGPVVENRIFTTVELMPEYPGGEDALIKFLSDHMTYPKRAMRHDIQGKVIVGFVVNEDGSISDINIKKGVDPDLDKEALRVVGLLPNFKPGKNHGKPAKVSFILPIKFSLKSW